MLEIINFDQGKIKDNFGGQNRIFQIFGELSADKKAV